MKTKPVLITLLIVILLGGAFWFVKGRSAAGPKKDGVLKFLAEFDHQLKAGNTDSLAGFFEIKQKTAVLQHLINVLTNKSGVKEGDKPIFSLTLDVDLAKVKLIGSDLADASIPARFINDSLPTKTTGIKFRIRRNSANEYKIVRVEANKMMSDYLAYNNAVKSKSLTDKDIFADVTVKAFETAKQLKSKYDTVVWLAHLDDKTYFYVVKGKWDQGLDIYRYKDTAVEPYAMGLVNPNLKEIIPPKYDLIHNISATFPGLIEVEKGSKKGFYDLAGNLVLPVNYDQVFPIEDDTNLAVLRNGDDYFYLKKDMTVSEKTDLKIGDFFSKIRKMGNSFNLYKSALAVVTEYNSREVNGAVYVPPSYLADLNITAKEEDFKNPLRKMQYDEVHEDYNVNFSNTIKAENNWLEASFYSIRDYFLGGRDEFYDKRNLVIIDKKRNRVFAEDIATDYSDEEGGGGSIKGICDISNIKAINDSLYEVKAGAVLGVNLYDSTKYISGGPYYHYMAIKGNQMTELRTNRSFSFTRFIKMDDSYLDGCYNLSIGTEYDNRKEKTINRLTPDILRYMKNEIYADYGYEFKDKRWQEVFRNMPTYTYDNNGNRKPGNTSVDDSLTAIDKFNINWINQKLKGQKGNTLASK